jgi:hypothetical protein
MATGSGSGGPDAAQAVRRTGRIKHAYLFISIIFATVTDFAGAASLACGSGVPTPIKKKKQSGRDAAPKKQNFKLFIG